MTHRVLLAATALAAAAACALRPAPAAAPARPERLPEAEISAAKAIEAAHVTNPHGHEGKPYCVRCHAGGKTAVADPVGLCAQCHAPSLMKHPYGVTPRTVPAALPLGPEQKIVCHTCHDPHDVKKHRKGLRLEYMPLCAQCHVKHGAKPHAPAAR